MQFEIIVMFVFVAAAFAYLGYRWGRVSYQDELTDILGEYIREKEKERKDKGGEGDDTERESKDDPRQVE